MPRPLSPAELAAWQQTGRPVHLLDVRLPAEHDLTALPGSQLIPLNDLPRRWREVSSTPEKALVCYCHHGVRSWHAAAFLESQGISPVYSLEGGIDAWSCQIDTNVPRYQ